jgi:hypothetical protein
MVIEVENAHRNVKIVRQLGCLAMKNPYTRLLLAIRIWEKSDDGCFGAAAVLWGKDEDGIISVRNAVDFGTRELTASAKSGFEVDDDDSMLPGVKTWTRPAPSPGHTSLRYELEVFDFSTIGIRPSQTNPDWCLLLPKADLLYKTSTSASTDALPYVLNLPAVQAFADCCIDLQWFIASVNSLKSL